MDAAGKFYILTIAASFIACYFTSVYLNYRIKQYKIRFNHFEISRVREIKDFISKYHTTYEKVVFLNNHFKNKHFLNEGEVLSSLTSPFRDLNISHDFLQFYVSANEAWNYQAMIKNLEAAREILISNASNDKVARDIEQIVQVVNERLHRSHIALKEAAKQFYKQNARMA